MLFEKGTNPDWANIRPPAGRISVTAMTKVNPNWPRTVRFDQIILKRRVPRGFCPCPACIQPPTRAPEKKRKKYTSEKL